MYSYNDRIKQLRIMNGKTQSQVAEDLKVSVDSIAKIEQGRKYFSVEMVLKLSDYYHVSTDYILKGIPDTMSELASYYDLIPEEDKAKALRIMVGMLKEW